MPPQPRRPAELARPGARSLVQVRIGNQVYDAVHQSSCHTCNHPARMEIEADIVKGFSYRKIAEKWSGIDYDLGDGSVETMPEVGRMSIRNHFLKGHMPVEGEARRRLAERRATKVGMAIEDGVDRLVDQYTLAEAVVHETYDGLVTGRLKPELRDGLKAAKFLQEIENRQQGEGFEAEAWSKAMIIYFETAQAMMPAPMWAEFGQRLKRDPILAALHKKLTPQGEEDDVVDADVVEDEGDPRG